MNASRFALSVTVTAAALCTFAAMSPAALAQFKDDKTDIAYHLDPPST